MLDPPPTRRARRPPPQRAEPVVGWRSSSVEPGTVLRGNLLHDVQRGPYSHGAPNNGIFFDQGSKGYLVEGNIIYNTSGKPVRFNQCTQEDHTWKHNSLGIAPDEAGFPQEAAAETGPYRENGGNCERGM